MPGIFLTTRENHGHPIAVWREPILNPNRGSAFPIFGYRAHPSSRGLRFRPKSEQSLAAISWENGAILEAHWLPGIFHNIRQNHGHPIAVWRGPILNPNRGRLCAVLGIAPSPPPEAFDLALNLSNPYPRLAGKNGDILEAHWLPRIFLEIRGGRGHPIAVRRDQF